VTAGAIALWLYVRVRVCVLRRRRSQRRSRRACDERTLERLWGQCYRRSRAATLPARTGGTV